jgi:Lrp/AsnC family transcriptional regulator, leucine-responsive regulatory protein
MTISKTIDQADRRILAELQQNGRISIVELAEAVNLSKSPCLTRLRRLEKAGYIRGYYAQLDPKKLAHGYLVYVQVKLIDTTRASLEEFNRAAREVPQIQSCHMVSGGYDYLLKVRTRDMDTYRALLGDVISALPKVGQTSTYPVMEQVKDNMFIGVDAIADDD